MIRTRREPPKRKTLDDILAEGDELGLLRVAPAATSVPSADQRLITALQNIEAFVRDKGREPDETADDLSEATLAVQLASLRQDKDHAEGLADWDSLGLLNSSTRDSHTQAQKGRSTDHSAVPEKPTAHEQASASVGNPYPDRSADSVTSLDDIWNSDALGLLSDDDESVNSIFDMTHVPEVSERDMPDEIAQRTHCEDFYRFEGLFEQVREELREDDAEAIRFQKESQIEKGEFFIVNGMMCLVDEVGENEGENGRYNPRLRVIFDNGTESNLLLRSLARSLYKDETGRRILRPDTTLDAMQGITHHDKRTGVIYILRSLSQDPALQGIRNLHKIGYTEKKLEQRIASAERQQTYLEAPVKVVTSFECYNLDPRRFERLVHAMLHQQRVNVLLRSRDGESYRPREWFDVELDAAREIVKRIADGTIAQYRMDNTTGRLIRK
ncbi:GIY-YIG nuclease family protein [Vreelandella aquamarina]